MACGWRLTDLLSSCGVLGHLAAGQVKAVAEGSSQALPAGRPAPAEPRRCWSKIVLGGCAAVRQVFHSWSPQLHLPPSPKDAI